MKKILLFSTLCLLYINSYAQGYNQERTALANFIERLYKNAPFEGCRIVDDYDNSYLLSVVELDKSNYQSASAMNRVAQVKSQRNAGEFFNGTQSYSEITIRTPKSEKKGEVNMAETYEIIKTNSTGYVQRMELLTTFVSSENKAVFIFYKKIEL